MENILGTIIALFGTLGISFAIEKSPIKINPLSILKNFLVGDLKENINNLDKKVDKIDLKVDTNELDTIRHSILDYKKGSDNGVKLSQHEYEYILKIYDKYKGMGGNSFITDVVEQIKEMYKNQ